MALMSRAGRSRLLVPVVAALVVASCTSGTGSRPSGTAGAISSSITSAPPSSPIPSKRFTVVGPIDLLSSSLGLTAVQQCTEPGRCGAEHLLLTRDFGKTWRVLPLPRAKAGSYPYPPEITQIFFQDPSDGWLMLWSCARDRDTLLRTTNGGRTWRQSAAGYSSCNAGAGARVDFIDPHIGWMTHLEPTGPSASIQKSTDGGATWTSRGLSIPVVSHPQFLRPQWEGPLPLAFQNEVRGWVAGYSNGRPGLFRTADSARAWTSVALPPSPCCRAPSFEPDPPSFFGVEGVFANPFHRNGHGSVAFDITLDAGSTWRQSAILHIAGRSPAGSFLVRMASPTDWWIVAGKTQRLYRTTNGGMKWRTETLPSSKGALELMALDGRRAWLTLQDGPGTALYMTSNGGRTWSAARFPAGS